MSRENDIDQWIIRNAAKKEEQQSRVVPTAADQLTSGDPSRGEAAIEAVAAWMGAERDLPAVELAQVSPHAVKVTFAEDVSLPSPWINEEHSPQSDTWALTHEQAMALPRSERYGSQMTALTGLGNIVDGRRIFASTSRWGLLNIAGTDDWVESLLLGQIMNQAAEPWSSDCNIWLVGFGETAEKLTSFLAAYHPLHRFRMVDRVSQINAEEITSSTATVYVRNTENEDRAELLALSEAPDVGIVADRILSERHMFLTEGEDGSAVMGPFEKDLEVFPNIAPEAVEAMEAAWQAQQAYAEEVVAATDFSQLLFQGTEDGVTESENPDSDAADIAEVDIEIPPRPATLPPTSHDVEPLVEDATEHEPEIESAPDPEIDDDTQSVGESDGIALHLLGELRVVTAAGEITGRNAMALAILSQATNSVSVKEISERLWPGDDSAGHTARTRRSRLLTALRDKAGDIVNTEDEGWTLTEEIPSDFTAVLEALGSDSSGNDDAIIAACDRIEIPLAGESKWPHERDTMTEQLRNALQTAKDQAIKSEAYDVAKAVKRAEEKLEG